MGVMPMNTKINYEKNNLLRVLENELNTAGGSELRDIIVSKIYREAEIIADSVVSKNNSRKAHWDEKLDHILTSKYTGFPIMFILLGLIFWITISGANIPSQMLSNFFFLVENRLTSLFISMNAPEWIHGILVLGVYRTLAWVISVMLPPMAIFFPLFTLLEDLGYLPRVAFNLDKLFKNLEPMESKHLP